MGSELGQKVRVAAVDTVAAVSGVGGIGEITSARPERNTAVNIAAQVGNSGVAQVGGVNALRKQSEGLNEIEVLGVIIQAALGLYLATPYAEPAGEPVICNRPVERRVPLSQIAQVAVVDLSPDPKLIVDGSGYIEPKIRKRAAALAAMRGQPVVVVGVYEPLRGESVHLERVTEKRDFLGMEDGRSGADG